MGQRERERTTKRKVQTKCPKSDRGHSTRKQLHVAATPRSIKSINLQIYPAHGLISGLCTRALQYKLDRLATKPTQQPTTFTVIDKNLSLWSFPDSVFSISRRSSIVAMSICLSNSLSHSNGVVAASRCYLFLCRKRQKERSWNSVARWSVLGSQHFFAQNCQLFLV